MTTYTPPPLEFVKDRITVTVTELPIAASNDFELGEALATAAASRPKPKPDVLRSNRQPRPCSGGQQGRATNDNSKLTWRAA